LAEFGQTEGFQDVPFLLKSYFERLAAGRNVGTMSFDSAPEYVEAFCFP
jgi:hypothetical protein